MACVLHFPEMPRTTRSELLPNRVRYWRERRGLTLRELAPRLGLSFGSLGRIETGGQELSQYWMERIGRELEVEPADLLLPEHGGLTAEERLLVDTFREVPEQNRRMLLGVAESQQSWRGAPEQVPLDPARRKAS